MKKGLAKLLERDEKVHKGLARAHKKEDKLHEKEEKLHHMSEKAEHKVKKAKKKVASKHGSKKKVAKKNFIAGAIKHPGALRKELHVKKDKKIPAAKLKKAVHAKGKEGQRARFALTLAKLRKKK